MFDIAESSYAIAVKLRAFLEHKIHYYMSLSH